MSENPTPLKTINISEQILGFLRTPHAMRFSKRTRNPDVFTYDHSIDYKEGYGLIEESFCDCGCKSSIYVKEKWNGEWNDIQTKTQVEWEALPNQPKPTKEQVKLQTDIILADREEEKLGIIHGQESCSMIPILKLVLRKPCK